MPLSGLILLPTGRQLLQGIRADRFEHAEARVVGGCFSSQQAHLEKGPKGLEGANVGVTGGTGHGLCCLDGESAGKDGQAAEERLLLGSQEIVGPRDRRVHGLLT
jgi:hypothetical protein